MKTNNTLALIITLVVLFVGGYFLFKNGKVTPNPVVPKDNSNVVSGEVVFTDQSKTVNFKYPKDFLVSGTTVGTPSWRVNTQSSGTTLAKVTIPKSTQPETNFAGATFTVGSSGEASQLTNCLVPTNGEVALGTAVINGITYTKIGLSDAGAGNFYNTTSYRTVRSGKCYAVEYTIHSTNIGAYSTDQGIKEFDLQKVTATLESIVQSVQFLAPTSPIVLGKVTVTALEVLEDSRCPSGVQCIWAGTVRVKVKVTNKIGMSAEGTLTLGEPKTIAGVLVTLTEVAPEKTDKTLVFSDYRFTFSTK